MLVAEARRVCPDLVLVNGEDLTRFRRASKRLWAFLRSHSWNDRVERLGLDEVFLDVTDIVAYNAALLNPHALGPSGFFQLSPHDPESGFGLDAPVISGSTFPADSPGEDGTVGPLYTRLMLASHLASYLRRGLEEGFGYTSTCGIATNKTLAKMVGSMNKPKNQTTLLSFCDDDVQTFMRQWPLRSIPGLGSKASHLIQEYVRANSAQEAPHDAGISSENITTREVLDHPGLSVETLDGIVGGPGTERGLGARVWALLHGVDNTEVKEACDVPSQISVEDTYVARPINTQAELLAELYALALALIRRLRTDLLPDGGDADASADPPRWLAYPRTLRLATRVKRTAGGAAVEGRPDFHRSTRSAPLPRFVFGHRESAEALVERLVRETVMPLFRRLHGERQGWNLALLNLGATNMVLTGSEDGSGAGGRRDIAAMFKTQDAKLKEFTTYNNEPTTAPAADTTTVPATHTDEPRDEQAAWQTGTTAWEDDEEQESSLRCPMCGQPIPTFAMNAHQRFHTLSD